MITPSAAVADPPKISEAVSGLVDGAKFDKRYDGYYFDDKMDAEKNRVFRAYAARALHAFKQTMEKNKDDWKVVLDDAFRTSVSLNENDQFVFELPGKEHLLARASLSPGVRRVVGCQSGADVYRWSGRTGSRTRES